MVIGAILAARTALWNEFTKLHREMLRVSRADKVCQKLMTTPGVGALVALTYRSAVDDPTRFGRSSTVGAHFGLTPKKYQSDIRAVFCSHLSDQHVIDDVEARNRALTSIDFGAPALLELPEKSYVAKKWPATEGKWQAFVTRH